MTINDIYRRIISNFKILGLGKVFAGLCSALTIFILARHLGVEGFGILAIAISIVEVGNVILSLRVWESSTKFLGSFINESEKVSQLLIWSLKLALKSSLASNLLICIFSYYFINDIFEIDFSISALVLTYSFFYLFNTSNEIMDGFLRTYNKYLYILINNITSNLIRLIFIFIIIKTYDDLVILIAGMGTSIIVGFLFRIFFIKRTFNEKNISLSFGTEKINDYKKEFLGFAVSTHSANMINLANEKNLGVLLIGYLVGPFYAGLFKAARSIVKIIRRIMDPLLDIIYPEFISLVNKGRTKDLKKLIFNSTKILSIISIIVGSLIFILSEEIIIIFFGSEYINSAFALNLLIIAALINNASYWITPWILAINKPKYLLFITISVSFAYILTLYPLIINLEHIGAAYSGILRASITLLLGLYFFNKFMNKKTT